MCKVSIHLKQNCRSSQLKITSFLYTDRHGRMDTRMERQADSSIPPKTFVLQRYKTGICITLSFIYTHFNKRKKKALRKHCEERSMSNFTFLHYVICILKSFNSHISVVVCSFFEFGKVSKWCIREWVKEGRKYCGHSAN